MHASLVGALLGGTAAPAPVTEAEAQQLRAVWEGSREALRDILAGVLNFLDPPTALALQRMDHVGLVGRPTFYRPTVTCTGYRWAPNGWSIKGYSASTGPKLVDKLCTT